MNIKNFLSTDLFIYWRINPNKELDKYWSDFILQNKNLEDDFNKAIKEFDRIQNIPDDFYLRDEDHIKQRIDKIILLHKKTKNRRLYYYSSVAAIFLFLIVSTFFINNKNNLILTEEFIVGQIVPQNEILLLSGEEVIKINNNATLDISTKENTTIIRDSVSEKIVKLKENQTSKLIVPYGKRTSVILSDGSKVWLNSGSEMEFPSVFSGEIREIKVKGEIFIDVKQVKNKSFVVNTANSLIKVYGTSFNVSAYEDEESESIVLVEGSVEVQSKNASLILKPNHIAEIKNGMIDSRSVKVSEYISWKSGFIVLNKTPLNEVLKKVGRYYNVEFLFNSDSKLHTKTCSGKLILSDNIEDVLNSFTEMTLLKYAYEQKDIIYIKE